MRRWRLQLSRVCQVKSRKRRVGLPVCWPSSAAAASSALISSTSRVLRARPNRKSTALASHHAISASRAKPGIGAQQDAHPGPALADAGDDPSHRLDAAGAAIDVGRTQFARQQVPAAEYVERQIAVIVVVAVKE